ncbi:MAG: NifB/NifX family molybdenum-iron cluster-binding protein [Chloroflexota bacterium]|jgi:predicted Fe-Mo cluster-binding NifX family protein
MPVRIAVSADSNNGMDSLVSAHFGRCPYFVLVDVDNGSIVKVETVANPYYGNHQPGQVPAFINDQKTNVMLAGGMGAGAVSFFNQYGIEVATGASGTVREAVERYLGGSLSGVEPCCPDESGHHHHG